MKINAQYSLSPNQKKSLLIAAAISLLAQWMPLLNIVSQIYSTLFHEFGHAVTAWLFGYIAIPRLDFINGGGVTHLLFRPLWVSALAWIFIGLNLLMLKKLKPSKSNLYFYMLFGFYLLFFFTDLHRLLITFMGKGGELLFFYFVGWYALSQLIIRMNYKALIYLVLAVFLWVNSVVDSLKLIFNKADRLWYEAGKQDLMGGTPLVNDLVKLTQSTWFSFNFYNYLLLILAFYSLHKLLKIADVSVLDQNRMKQYKQNLLQISQQQIDKVKALVDQSKK